VRRAADRAAIQPERLDLDRIATPVAGDCRVSGDLAGRAPESAVDPRPHAARQLAQSRRTVVAFPFGGRSVARTDSGQHANVSQFPFVTIVIPALNEARVIGGCLRALLAQTYPRDRFEVVVVDNGSTDNTATIAQEAGATVMHVAERNAYVARNAAIRATSGEYLAFTDADCVPGPGWIEELVAAESRQGTGVVAGHIDYRMSFESLGNRMLIASRNKDVIRENVCIHRCAPTGNVMIRRQLLDEHGLFCEAAYGSDIAMSKRLSGLGHPPVFAPDAVVVHLCDLSSREYLNRTYWNSRGNAVHDPGAATVGRLLHEALQFPWRPGFRTVASVQEAVADRARSAFVPTWLYMWLSRFAGYAGRIAGTMSRALSGNQRPAACPTSPRDVDRSVEPAQHSALNPSGNRG